MSRNRFADAVAIQGGACNPHGIARSLLSALDECRAANMDTPQTCADSAVRLIAHQLAFLLHVGELDAGTGTRGAIKSYSDATRECETNATT